MDLILTNWIKDGKYRIAVLKMLVNSNLLSSELASKLEINRTSMSRILRDLKNKGLVKQTAGESRTITYSITASGKKALEEL